VQAAVAGVDAILGQLAFYRHAAVPKPFGKDSGAGCGLPEPIGRTYDSLIPLVEHTL